MPRSSTSMSAAPSAIHMMLVKCAPCGLTRTDADASRLTCVRNGALSNVAVRTSRPARHAASTTSASVPVRLPPRRRDWVRCTKST
eukprot:6913665-Prymnesium_polylepis.1